MARVLWPLVKACASYFNNGLYIQRLVFVQIIVLGDLQLRSKSRVSVQLDDFLIERIEVRLLETVQVVLDPNLITCGISN